MSADGVTNGQPRTRIAEPKGTQGWVVEGAFFPKGESDQFAQHGGITQVSAEYVSGFAEICKIRDWAVVGVWSVHGGFDTYAFLIEHFDFPKARPGHPYPEVILNLSTGEYGTFKVEVEKADTPRMFLAPVQLVEVTA